MKKEFSASWRGSKQPRKQRKFRANAPLHIRSGMISAHLSKQLREYGRSATLRKGDEIVIMRGKHRKTRGKIERIDYKSLKVYIEGLKRKRTSGQEVMIPIDASNLSITKLNLDDPRRKKSMDRKRKPKPAEKKAVAVEKREGESK